MLINYIRIAWRTLFRFKTYSFINITGLSIGMAACLIVATVVIDELSYDKQWHNADNIYRVISVTKNVKGDERFPLAFAGLSPALKQNFSEVDDYVRMSVSNTRLRMEDNKEGIVFKNLYAETGIWNVLDFDITAGNPAKFVKGYTNLIITEKIKNQYFRGQNPIGKVVMNQPQYSDPEKYIITGVVKSIPKNTHLRADVITLSEYAPNDNRVPKEGEGYSFVSQYLLLKPGVSAAAFAQKINNWYTSQMASKKPDYLFQLQPIKDVYLKTDFSDQQEVKGSMRNVYIFAGVAVLLLVIACINFINLTVSRIFNRASETGVRKVLGAARSQLIVRFSIESVMFFVIAFVIATAIYPLLIKPVETYLGHELVINLYNRLFLVIAIIGVLAISVLTGLYPAWMLSKPNPVVLLKNKISAQVQLGLIKKVLITGQFVIAVTIIVVTLVVHNQLNYMDNKPLGFDKNNLVNINYTAWGSKAALIKQQVKDLPGVEGVSISDWYPSGGPGTMSKKVSVAGQKEKVGVNYIWADADLTAVLKLKLDSGRMLSTGMATDAMDADSMMNGTGTQTKAEKMQQPYLVTAYTAKVLGLKINTPDNRFEGIPVGIIEDFHNESLYTKMQPCIIQATKAPQWGNMLIRVQSGHEKAVLAGVNKLYNTYLPGKTFKYDWVNELIAAQYANEHRLQQLFTCFSLLIIALACLGLVGLISFAAEQRRKEIGIRKVLGSSVAAIVSLISKEFMQLTFMAIIIASPIAWYCMHNWLQDFAYRVTIQWWVFALAGIIAMLIAAVTISFQSVKAAIANPVKNLRNE